MGNIMGQRTGGGIWGWRETCPVADQDGGSGRGWATGGQGVNGVQQRLRLLIAGVHDFFIFILAGGQLS